MNRLADILNSKPALKQIILSKDRHDLSNFLYSVQEALRSGYITEEDFRLFRNGFAIDCVLNLTDDLKEQKRELQTAELLDKINYLSLVPDTESLNTTYTHPQIIEGVSRDDHDLAWWYKSGTFNTLPVETKVKIGIKLLELGNISKAKEVMQSINHELEYTRNNEKKGTQL